MRYEVVSQEIVFAALNSDPITAYVEAVIVPSNPERNTLEKSAILELSIASNRGDKFYLSQSKEIQVVASNSHLRFSGPFPVKGEVIAHGNLARYHDHDCRSKVL